MRFFIRYRFLLHITFIGEVLRSQRWEPEKEKVVHVYRSTHQGLEKKTNWTTT